MKISVIGYSGCGKSSFAKKLAEHYKIDPTYLDKMYFEPGWIERDRTLVKEELEEIIKTNQWVVEGNYFRVDQSRFDLADMIFVFSFNRFKCLYGAILRRIKFANKSRNSMRQGNKEKLDFQFFWWLIYKGRRANRKRYKLLISKYPDKVVIFKKRRQVNKYLASIGINDFKACP